MRVFVLSTGRCGSTTFARACAHVTNFTAGHETRAHKIGLDERLGYPDGHIEVDNRLVWFLDLLAERYPDAYWVHLTRDPEAVVESFVGRWDQGRSNMTRAFGHGIVVQPTDYSERDRRNVCRMYVDTVTAKITRFLRDRDHLQVALETVDVDFVKFLDRIGVEGDLDTAMAEWGVRHNASRQPPS